MEDQWWIAQGDNVQGPFTTDVVRRFIRAGRATEDLRYSRDGGTWTVGREFPALFAPPPTIDNASDPRTRVEAYGRVFDDSRADGGQTFDAVDDGPPVSIKVASWIVYLTAILLLFSVCVRIASVPGGADARDLLPLLLALFMALLYAVLGYLLVKGHHYARITLIVVNVIWAISYLRHMGGGRAWILSAMVFPLIVVGTLLSDSAIRHCMRRDGSRSPIA